MILKTLQAAVSAAALCTILGYGAASAATLYDNGAPNGTIMGQNITGTDFNARTDSFTLSQDSIVTGITFASWDYPGSAMASVGYAFESSPNTNVALTIAPTVSTYDFTNPNNYNIDEDTFSTGSIKLTAGTHYLVLGEALQTDGSGGYWDENDGPSSAYIGTGTNSPVGSASFQVLGTNAVSAAPEPSTWLLMFAGIGGIGLMLRQAKRKMGFRFKDAFAV